MGSTAQITVTAPTGKQLSTIDPNTRAPRKVYNNLGVYLYTDADPALTYELAKSEITSLFAFLNPLNLTLSEYVRLVNLQLIPTLEYRLMAHPLEQSQLKQLQNIFWKNVALDPDPQKRNRISRLVAEKDKYVPTKNGGLEPRHFQHSLNISTVNSAITYLNNEGPENTNKIFRQAALSTEESLVHKLICNACHSLNLRFNSLNHERSTPPKLMHQQENIYVRFSTYSSNRVTKWGNKQRPPNTDLGIYRRVVVDTSDDQAFVYFSGDDTTFTLRDSQKFNPPSPSDIGPPQHPWKSPPPDSSLSHMPPPTG